MLGGHEWDFRPKDFHVHVCKNQNRECKWPYWPRALEKTGQARVEREHGEAWNPSSCLLRARWCGWRESRRRIPWRNLESVYFRRPSAMATD